jgi:hypothetical protein
MIKKILLWVLTTILVLAAAFVGYVYWINRPLPQNEFDVVILQRTIELLGNQFDWSQTGDRSCKAEGPPFNLYCALRQASVDVTGEFKHRAAALQAVRHAIEQQNPGVEYAHRLMDYNNDPGTSFEDLREVLQISLTSLQASGN